MSPDERAPNPYEAPRAPVGADRRLARPAVEPPFDPKTPISVAHDLNDDDLRRFVNCDTYYDPMPLFGFIAQWVWFMPITAAIGFTFGFARLRSIRMGLVMAPAFSLLVLAIQVGKAGFNRRNARALGLCDSRTLTITPRGLTLAIAGAKHPPTELASVGPAEHPWGDFRKIDATEGYITFWLKGRSRLVLPRRAFSSPAGADAFLQAATWWLANTA